MGLIHSDGINWIRPPGPLPLFMFHPPTLSPGMVVLDLPVVVVSPASPTMVSDATLNPLPFDPMFRGKSKEDAPQSQMGGRTSGASTTPGTVAPLS